MKKRADGRYVKVITDPKTHKRISFYGKSAREVNKKILGYEETKEHGRTFSTVANEWWSDTYEDLAPQTLKGYKPAYAKAVDYFGDIFINEIEPRHILAFYKVLAGQDYTAKTISNHRIIINQIFNRAVLDGDILFNPCTSVKIPKAKKNTPRAPASISDEQKILESDHKWLFPLVALLTGLRKGEILALQWQDINFEDKCISVTKSVEHIGKKPHLKEPKTKSGTRTVPLLDMLALRLLPLADKSNLFIFSEDGGRSPLYEHRYTKFYKEYQQEVGITATAHQLRHSYATIAVELDVNPKDLQATLGHADISTTMNVYAAVRKKSLEKVAEKLNERYRNN